MLVNGTVNVQFEDRILSFEAYGINSDVAMDYFFDRIPVDKAHLFRKAPEQNAFKFIVKELTPDWKSGLFHANILISEAGGRPFLNTKFMLSESATMKLMDVFNRCTEEENKSSMNFLTFLTGLNYATPEYKYKFLSIFLTKVAEMNALKIGSANVGFTCLPITLSMREQSAAHFEFSMYFQIEGFDAPFNFAFPINNEYFRSPMVLGTAVRALIVEFHAQTTGQRQEPAGG